MAELYADINPAVLRNVPAGSTVLDVGCGIGVLGAVLKRKRCTVTGIDYSQQSVNIAAKRLDEVHLLNIEEREFSSKKKYDVIILADVLEHLRNPEQALLRLVKHLAPGGRVIVSLPNVASWTIRLKLLFGSFTYTPSGILDETHLHLYTLKTGKTLVESAGLRVEKIDLTPNFVRAFLPLIRKAFGSSGGSGDERILQSPAYQTYSRFVQPVETAVARLWKKLFAYQLVFVARKQ
jgi:methionine biosynthesis protein MetW